MKRDDGGQIDGGKEEGEGSKKKEWEKKEEMRHKESIIKPLNSFSGSIITITQGI